MAGICCGKPVDNPVDRLSPILGTIMEFGDSENRRIPPPATPAPQVTAYGDSDQDQGTVRGRS